MNRIAVLGLGFLCVVAILLSLFAIGLFVKNDIRKSGTAEFTGDVTLGSSQEDRVVINGTISGVGGIEFEGFVKDEFETKFAFVEPLADSVITFPNETGTVVVKAQDTNVLSVANNGSLSLHLDPQGGLVAGEDGLTLSGNVVTADTLVAGPGLSKVDQTISIDNTVLTESNIVAGTGLVKTGKTLAVDDSIVTESNLLVEDGLVKSGKVISLDAKILSEDNLTVGTGLTKTGKTLEVDTSIVLTENNLGVSAGLSKSGKTLSVDSSVLTESTVAAGTGISISGQTFSVASTVLTESNLVAGTGLTKTGKTLEVDTSLVLTESNLVAGTGLSKTGKTLSIDADVVRQSNIAVSGALSKSVSGSTVNLSVPTYQDIISQTIDLGSFAATSNMVGVSGGLDTSNWPRIIKCTGAYNTGSFNTSLQSIFGDDATGAILNIGTLPEALTEFRVHNNTNNYLVIYFPGCLVVDNVGNAPNSVQNSVALQVGGGALFEVSPTANRVIAVRTTGTGVYTSNNDSSLSAFTGYNYVGV